MRIDSVEFVRSAATPADFPSDGLPEIALVGRSNVGQSSLINALVGRPVARTSAAPGKTRLVNVYRVRPAGRPPFYMVDLPGYGYARGAEKERAVFAALTEAYFSRQATGDTRHASSRLTTDDRRQSTVAGVILAVDARHPGLAADIAASAWVEALGVRAVAAATKIDKLGRPARAAACRRIETTLTRSVLPVSAATGEGLDDLWKVICSWTSEAPPPGGNRSSNWRR